MRGGWEETSPSFKTGKPHRPKLSQRGMLAQWLNAVNLVVGHGVTCWGPNHCVRGAVNCVCARQCMPLHSMGGPLCTDCVTEWLR